MDFTKIRKIRKSCGITQEELAKSIGVNRATLSKYENGDIDLPTSQLERIAAALEVPVWEFMDSDTAIPFKEKLLDELSIQLKKKLLDELSAQRGTGTTPLSQDAVQVAEDYDALDVWGKKHVRATVDMEKERVRQQQGADPRHWGGEPGSR